MQKMRIISLILVLCFSLNTNASWLGNAWNATKNFFTKNPIGKNLGKGALNGAGFAVGSLVVDAVVNWVSGGNNKGGGGRVTVAGGSSSADYSKINARIDQVNQQLNNISNKLNKMEADIENIKQVVNDQGKVLQAHTLMLEKIRLEQIKENVLKDVTLGSELAFDRGPEEVRKYIDEQMSKIKDEQDPLIADHRLALLNTVMQSSMGIMNELDDKGNTLFSIDQQTEILSLSKYLNDQIQSSANISEGQKTLYTDLLSKTAIESKEKL